MDTLQDLLDAYPGLSPEERATADVRLAGHPGLAEAQRLAALVDAARRDQDGVDLAAETLGRWFSADESPAADADRDAIAANLRALAAEAADPIRQFERLTGRALQKPRLVGDSAPDRPPVGVEASRPRLRRVTWLPRIAVAAAVVLVAYGSMAVVSASSVSERVQVAALSGVEPVELPALRGEPLPAADRLTAALTAVRDARQTTWGLFPHYDDDALDAAADELMAVVDDAAPDSWVSQEARIALGRVLVYRERDVEAARVLGGLVEEGSYQSATARRLLDFLRAAE